VVPSSTQFLPLNRTESVDFHRFNQRVFQQNRSKADIRTTCLFAQVANDLYKEIYAVKPRSFRTS
jgi:hypothetical protein